MTEFKFPTTGKTRTEHDLLGYKEVPAEALFGIQTLRCIENFNISNYHLCDYPEFIKAFGIVKMAAHQSQPQAGPGIRPDQGCHRGSMPGTHRRQTFGVLPY